MGEKLGRAEIFQVLVVHNDVNWSCRPLEIVSPSFECFEDSEEFLVICVVVQLHSRETSGKEGDWVDLAIGICLREDCHNGIV